MSRTIGLENTGITKHRFAPPHYIIKNIADYRLFSFLFAKMAFQFSL